LEGSRKAVGYPIPNSDQPKKDRNPVKVCNCYNPEGWSWGKMNEFNHKLMTKRLEEGRLTRNLHVASVQELGWNFMVLVFIPMCKYM
jgi:hypothetical protein